MTYVMDSDIGMHVQRLIWLVDTEDGMMVHVRWSGLSKSEDTLELVARVNEDVAQLSKKLLDRKNAPIALVAKTLRELRLWRRYL